MAGAPRTYWGGWALWYGVLGGIVSWAFHITGMPALTPFVCHSGQGVWFHALSAATLVLAVGALAVSWGYSRGGATEGIRFLGFVGMVANVLSIFAIALEWVPVFVLRPCAS